MKKSFYRQIIAIGIFTAVAFIYFYPALLGYSLKMADISSWKGMAKEVGDYRALFGSEPLWTNSMFGGMPAFQISVTYAANLINYIYQALFIYPGPTHFFFIYALGFYILLLSLRIEYKIAIIGALAYALSSYFLIILEAGHTSKAAAIGYMAPVLAGFILTYRGKIWLGLVLSGLAMALELRSNHLQITYYLGFVLLAFVLAEFIRAYHDKNIRRFIRQSMALGIVLIVAILTNAGNLYNTLSYSKYTTRGPSELTIKADGTPNNEIKTNGLDRDYVTDWSYGKEESFSFIIPDVKGGATGSIGNDPALLKSIGASQREFVAKNNRYWGDQRFTSGPVYLGIIMFWLFLLGLFSLKSRYKWAILAVILLALFLSWGKNLMWFTDLFLNYMPGYNKFRAVTIILVIIEMLVPLLGLIYLNRLFFTSNVFLEKFKIGNKEIGSKFMVVSALLFLVLLFFFIAPDTFFTFFSDQEKTYFTGAINKNNAVQVQTMMDALKDVRISIFKADVLRSMGFLIVAFVVLVLYKTKTISSKVAIVGLGLLIIIDPWGVDKRYLNNEKSRGKYVKWEKKEKNKPAYIPSKADLSILNRELLFNSEKPELNELAQEAIKNKTEELRASGELKGKLSPVMENDVKFTTLGFNSDFRVLNISVSTFNDASTSFFFKSIGGYHGAKLKIYQELIEFELQPEIQELMTRLKSGVSPHLAFKDMTALNMLNAQYLIYNKDAEPIENPNVLGNAWFPEAIKWVETPDEELLAIKEMDPAKTAVIREKYRDLLPGFDINSNEENAIELMEYRPNNLIYVSNLKSTQLTVFSEIWYPDGWVARIDGKKADIIRVNYVLRGLVIPSGEHKVVFSFEPPGYQTANIVSFASSFLLILFGLWVAVKFYKRKLVASKE